MDEGAGGAEVDARHRSAGDERISGHQPWEPAEVPIRCPQFAHAVELAERGHARVVHQGAGDPALDQGGTQAGPVTLGLGEEDEARGLEPRLHLIQRDLERARRGEDTRMGDDGQELVDAGPRDRPGCPVFSELPDPRGCRVVPGRVFAVGVDEEVRVDRDPPPRASYAISRMRSQEAPAAPG